MDITNKTRKPLTVPLPGRKKLFLGPGKTGQISPKAADHPPLKELIESGDLEVLGAGRSKSGGGSGSNLGTTSSQNTPSGGVRHTGDR